MRINPEKESIPLFKKGTIAGALALRLLSQESWPLRVKKLSTPEKDLSHLAARSAISYVSSAIGIDYMTKISKGELLIYELSRSSYYTEVVKPKLKSAGFDIK